MAEPAEGTRTAILTVDDDPGVSRAVARDLRRRYGEQHRVVRAEDWFWNFETEEAYTGPELAPPVHHPVEQPVPGPAGRVPRDWRFHIH